MDRDREGTGKRSTDFVRNELGELLRLFTSLGITVALGITGFFLLGIHLDGRAAAAGIETRGAARILGILVGLFLSVSWAYMRISRHLEKYPPRWRDASRSGGEAGRERFGLTRCLRNAFLPPSFSALG